MLKHLDNFWNKGRFSGIRIVPKNSPTLYQEVVKQIVAELNRTNTSGKRVSQMQFLPTVILVSLFEEMCLYPGVRGILGQLLSDPNIFLRILNGHKSYRPILDRCLRETSSGGIPVLSNVANKYCDMTRKDPLEPGSPTFMCRIREALKLGTYLHEAGWNSYSIDILTIAKDMISLIEDNRSRKELELQCIQKLLRSQSSNSDLNAKQTCDILLQLIAEVIDTDDLVKSYIEIAHFYCSLNEFDRCHDWSLRAMKLITDSSPVGDIIAVLLIEAQFCFAKQRYDLGNMLLAQAILRTRTWCGTINPNYAPVMFTYGKCLMQMNAISDSISAFVELLDVTNKLYGLLTPTIPIVMGHLAYGFYVRSHATQRFDMARDEIEKAIALAKQLSPMNKRVLEYLDSIRAKIAKGRDSALADKKEHKATKASEYAVLSFLEIRDLCIELNISFD